ncbi:N-6 DNA methylase [Acidovorax sp.]|uniref:N-6 DNA methylase n=1 Tax=Acidovorax sp. TaxID=1872122 RepID=UPI0025B98024|nr:N-6 DNA methylase [Acidovorax sp.]MBW8465802.1 N-6 DNA methylase [Acidovorax sp.]
MAPSQGGYEMLALYSEAIQSMRENPGVPELFRDIFKNAYLPYRDPETLKSFLKEINGFTYDHSERLGDAFEYLLSVLGSQGDAGQFRTPRHIIDFMVAVIDPQKNDTILDPACGTAGFLISAWKHILRNNSSQRNVDGRQSPKTLQTVPGDLLTPDERTRLSRAIRGYDISPDMVRLSLVNLYLHGFADPQIAEYDTLTQDDKWNELADVILANPPFMSPKGGIKPHKRFSVQATRSEVLFVDYMAEHLTATGRAAIVVPEGIIFQSGTAYKALRKMLVDSSLVAVVSLPAGVFNPYSGVKTSILILDKRVHKQTDSVLFVKVQNDGFNLGAQRRAVANSDLPEATRLLRSWMTAPQAFEGDGVMAQAVKRSRIGESGDFNLSGDRYITTAFAHTHYEVVRIADVCDVNPRKSELNDLQGTIDVSFVPMKDLAENSSSFVPQESRTLDEMRQGTYTYFRDGDVLVAKVTPCFENGKAGVARGLLSGIGFGSSEYYVLRPSERLLPELLYHFITSANFRAIATPAMTGTGGLQRVPKNIIEEFQIPLPPLEVQHQIVAEIDGYQKVIDGARQVIEHYEPHIAIDPVWPLVELAEVADFKNGLNYDADGAGPRIKILGVSHFKDHLLAPLADLTETQVNGIVDDSYMLKEGDIVFVRSNGNPALVGRSMLIPPTSEPTTFSGFTIRCRFKVDVEPYFYACLFKSALHRELLKDAGQGAGIRNLSQSLLKEIKVPLPGLDTQRAIVAEIEAEQALVNANRELIRRMEAKIKACIDRVWGGDAPPPPAPAAEATKQTADQPAPPSEEIEALQCT